MKKLICVSIFVFCFSVFAFAQASNSVCPEITVSGPDGLVNPGDKVKFTANVKSVNESLKLEFEWKVSQGEITSGQGTNQISVATTQEMAASNLTATVKLIGIPERCGNESSETAVIEQVIEREPVDSYGKKSLNDEKAILDNFIYQLQTNIGAKGYIYFGIEKSEELKTIKNRISKLMKHLDFRKINRNLVLIDVCYTDENQTVLWIAYDGVKLPDYGECEKVNIELK